MIPASQALLLSLLPAQRKGTALAIWSMTTLVAPICGPILGGYISDNYRWEWIFLTNVPVGLSCCAICWRFLRTYETATRKLSIDKVGLVLLCLWVGALQVMTISLDRLPPERVPAASGLNNFLRIISSSFATSLTSTYWDRREALHQSRLVESLSAYDPGYSRTLAQLHAEGFAGDSATAMVQRVVIGQGYLLSSLDIFYFSGWVLLFLIPLHPNMKAFIRA